MKKLYIASLALVVLLLTGCDLKIAKVRAPDINCLFDPSCKVVVTDTSSPISLPASGTMFLQSRTFKGKTGTQAEGLYAYLYRIDLRNGMGITHIPCIRSMTLTFEPLHTSLDYDQDGSPEQVFVITQGGIGNIGIASAQKNRNQITFEFESPVCVGSHPGGGDSTYFFGMTSPRPPEDSSALLRDTDGNVYSIDVRSAVPH